MAKCHPTKTIYLNAAGAAATSAFVVDNHSLAPNGVKAYTLEPGNTFSCANLGNNIVTLKITDSNDLFSTCSSNIVVMDSIRPVVKCAVYTVNLDAKGKGSITPENVQDVAKDNCDGVRGIAERKVSVSTFDCSNIPSATVVLTVTDKSGNENSCSAVVTVADKIAPLAQCRNATVKIKKSDDVTLSVKEVDNSTTDNCTLGKMTVKPATISAGMVGQTKTVTLTVLDASGNFSTCSSSVSVMLAE